QLFGLVGHVEISGPYASRGCGWRDMRMVWAGALLDARPMAYITPWRKQRPHLPHGIISRNTIRVPAGRRGSLATPPEPGRGQARWLAPIHVESNKPGRLEISTRTGTAGLCRVCPALRLSGRSLRRAARRIPAGEGRNRRSLRHRHDARM